MRHVCVVACLTLALAGAAYAGDSYDRAAAALTAKDAASAVKLATEGLQAVRVSPSDAVMLHAIRGKAYLALADDPDAIDDLTAAIGTAATAKDVCAAVGDVFVSRGDAYMGLRYFRKASEDYSRGLECEPGSADILFKLGEAYFNFDREKAEAAFTAALKISPNDPKILGERGKNYENMGKSELALADYTAQIRLTPDDAEPYNNRATIYWVLGRLDEAVADYSKSIAINPNKFLTYANRAYVYLAQGNYQAARADLAKAQALYRDQKADFEKKGGAAFARSVEAMMAQLDDSLKNAPDNPPDNRTQ